MGIREVNANLNGAILINGKNRQIDRTADVLGKAVDRVASLQNELDHLSDKFVALSQRNNRLEWLLASMVKKGVASEAIGTIHTLKAEALQKQADDENWGVGQRREANLKLLAEAEYDYRLNHDPSYRLNTAADALMKIASYSEQGDQIRKMVAQMYATGKIRDEEEKDRLITERVAELKTMVKYANDLDTVPTQESIPPMRLEANENDPSKYNSLTALDADGYSWVNRKGESRQERIAKISPSVS